MQRDPLFSIHPQLAHSPVSWPFLYSSWKVHDCVFLKLITSRHETIYFPDHLSPPFPGFANKRKNYKGKIHKQLLWLDGLLARIYKCGWQKDVFCLFFKTIVTIAYFVLQLKPKHKSSACGKVGKSRQGTSNTGTRKILGKVKEWKMSIFTLKFNRYSVIDKSRKDYIEMLLQRLSYNFNDEFRTYIILILKTRIPKWIHAEIF